MLASVERVLRGESAVLVDGEIERIMAKLRAAAEVWLREGAEMVTQLQLAPSQGRAPDSPGAANDAEDSDVIGQALHAAAHSRGALIDRVNATRLELASIKVKLAHVRHAATKEADAHAQAQAPTLAQLEEVREMAREAESGRDVAMMEMSRLIECAQRSEMALVAWQRQFEAVGDLGGLGGLGGQPPSSAPSNGSTPRAPAAGLESAGGGRQRLWAILQLLRKLTDASNSQIVAMSALKVGANAAAADAEPPPSMEGGQSDAARGVGAAAGAQEGAQEGSAAPATADAATPRLSFDTALRLAVRRVMSKHASGGSRWMHVIAAAGAAQQGPTARASEITAMRKAKRRIQRLEFDLQTLDRAVQQSGLARQRIEARLAKELYFQQLLRQRTEPTPQQREAAKGRHDEAALQMNDLRVRAMTEAKSLQKEIAIALREREEEHSNRVRAQLRCTVQRLLQIGVDDESIVISRDAKGVPLPKARRLLRASNAINQTLLIDHHPHHRGSSPQLGSPLGSLAEEGKDDGEPEDGLELITRQLTRQATRKHNLRSTLRAARLLDAVKQIAPQGRG